MPAEETISEEFARLVMEFRTSNGSEREEAWNLIADFALEHADRITILLRRNEQNAEK